MSESGSEKKLAKDAAKAEDNKQIEPQWASGLKHLYDTVVDEPLPDSFKDLLAQLDDEAGKK